LGLDVNLIADISQQVKINRAGLREKGPSKNLNVTDREKELFVIAQEKDAIAKKINPIRMQPKMHAGRRTIGDMS
jgi:hypothetical protein